MPRRASRIANRVRKCRDCGHRSPFAVWDPVWGDCCEACLAPYGGYKERHPAGHFPASDVTGETRDERHRRRRRAKEKRRRATRRDAIFERDGRRCVKCGSTENLTLDHVVPRSKGGTNALSNLRTLCGPCNQAKGDSLDES